MVRVTTRWALAAAAIAMVLVAAAGCSADGGAIDNARFKDLQAEGARIVDVRTAGEFAAGHIPGAELVPYQGIAQVAQGWDPTQPVVVYCAVGDRSAEAANVLRSMGFERVYDLTAGIVAWDGDIIAGEGAVATEPPAVQTSELPVLYEFFTDW
jgi:rhodanese-related sulfurtransferase